MIAMSTEKVAGPSLDDDDGEASIAGRATKVGRVYCCLQFILSMSNLVCFAFKLPFIVFVIRAVVEVLQLRAAAAGTTTLEPPYGDHEGFHHPDGPPAASTSSSSGTGAKIELLGLLLLYVAMLLVHMHAAYAFCRNKGYIHLALYFPLVGLWLFLAAFSYFIETWTWPLNCKFYRLDSNLYPPFAIRSQQSVILSISVLLPISDIFLVFKILIHGNDLFEPPSTYEFVLLRASMFVDGLTFVTTIAFAGLACWMGSERRKDCLNWKPHYNLVRLL